MNLETITLLGNRHCGDRGVLETVALLLRSLVADTQLIDLDSCRLGPPVEGLLVATPDSGVDRRWLASQPAKKILLLPDSGDGGNVKMESNHFDAVIRLARPDRDHAPVNSAIREWTIDWPWPELSEDWLRNTPRDETTRFSMALDRDFPADYSRLLEEALDLAARSAGVSLRLVSLDDSQDPPVSVRQSDLAFTARPIEKSPDLDFYCGFYHVPLIHWPGDRIAAGQARDPRRTAALLISLMERPLLRRALVKIRRTALHRRINAGFYEPVIDLLGALGFQAPEEPPALFNNRGGFRIEGPFDTSYSLAMVNRHTALALDELGEPTTLAPVEAFGNYPVDTGFYREWPQVERLVNTACLEPVADTVLRLMYPLRLTEMHGLNNGLCCYGWEESALPQKVVEDSNRHLHFATTMSHFVTRVLIENGVRIPVFTAGIGADHILEAAPDETGLPELGDGLRFLHISSCFPRKGIDLLLEAYGRAFTGDDEVALIIKTFPNPHHDIERMLTEWRTRLGDPPAVIVINRDLPDGAIRALYRNCHVLVAPSRGEGFGLPMAEAMLHDLPVITTAFGGQTDFCNEENAWLLDYTFAPADTHMSLMNSVWVEPSGDQLGEYLSQFHRAWTGGSWREFCERKTRNAFETVDRNFRWRHVARRIRESTARLEALPPLQPTPRTGVVTTWNSKCGIASYSRLLLQPELPDCFIFANRNATLIAPDGKHVVRCWDEGAPEAPDDLVDAILEHGIEQVLIQFNFGFFSPGGLKHLLDRLHDSGVQTFMTCHSTAGGWQDGESTSLGALRRELRRMEKIFVHSVNDLNRLKAFGVVDNTVLFPHGVIADCPAAALPLPRDRFAGKQVIASYGFLLPHKGLLELIEAFSQLRSERDDVHLLLVNAIYPAEISETEAVYCRNLIRRRKLKDHVTLITDFLEDRESIAWLRRADMILFPYQKTSESSSAAVRWGLASGKPVYCTPLPIFDDVRDAVNLLPGITAEAIRAGLETALDLPTAEREAIAQRQERWLREHDWYRLSARLRDIFRGSHLQKMIREQTLDGSSRVSQ